MRNDISTRIALLFLLIVLTSLSVNAGGWYIKGNNLHIDNDADHNEIRGFSITADYGDDVNSRLCYINMCEADAGGDDLGYAEVYTGSIIMHTNLPPPHENVGRSLTDMVWNYQPYLHYASFEPNNAHNAFDMRWNNNPYYMCDASCNGYDYKCSDSMSDYYRPKGDMLCELSDGRAKWIVCDPNLDDGETLFISDSHKAYECNNEITQPGTWRWTPHAFEICNDFFDNNWEESPGADCADPACIGNTGPMGELCQATESICDDSGDNDGDGLFDCFDSDCANDDYCVQGLQFQRWLPEKQYEWVDEDNDHRVDDNEWILTTQITAYDNFSNVLTEVYNSGNIIEKRYQDGLLVKTWNSEYGSEEDPEMLIEYSNGGLVENLTDKNGESTQRVYDGLGRIQKVIKPGDSLTKPTIQYAYTSYEGGGNLHNIIQLMSVIESTRLDNYRYSETVKYYDGFGRNVQTQLKKDETNFIVSNKLYNSQGRLWKEYYPDEEETRGLYNRVLPDNYVEYEYFSDPLNRVKKVINVDGSEVEYTYSASENGLPVLIVEDEENDQTRFTYDLLGNLLKVEQGTNFNIEFEYEYDAYGNIKSIKDPYGRELTKIFDDLGRVVAINSFDIGQISFDYSDSNVLRLTTLPEGDVIMSDYDLLDRTTKKIVDES